jgi:hypothetical protein
MLLVLVPLFSLWSTCALAQPSESRLALTTVLPAVQFSSTPLADALDAVADMSGGNINVDWKSLETAGVSRQTPVTVSLHDVVMSKVLSMLLSQAAGGETLTYYLDDNVIQITTQAVADKELVTVVYDVEDLVALDPNFNPTLPSVTISGGGGGGGGGGSSAVSSGGSNAGNNSSSTPDARAAQLIKIIENAVRPEIWKDNSGGGSATIEYWNGKLIVTAPRSVQQAIGGYLD